MYDKMLEFLGCELLLIKTLLSLEQSETLNNLPLYFQWYMQDIAWDVDFSEINEVF